MSPQECINPTHKHLHKRKVYTCMAYIMFNLVMFQDSPGWLKIKYAKYFQMANME